MITVYLLSILDSARDALMTVTICGGVAILACGIGMLWVRDFGEREHKPENYLVARRAIKALSIACAVSTVIRAFIPSPDALLKSYLMIEGSKLVTAENAGKATEEIVKRVDTLISKIGGGK